jgi:hypothetical protein
LGFASKYSTRVISIGVVRFVMLYGAYCQYRMVRGGCCVQVVEPAFGLLELSLLAIFFVHAECVGALTVTAVIGNVVSSDHVYET